MPDDRTTVSRFAAPEMLRYRLRDFYDEYFSCLDDQNLDEWPKFFTEDGFYLVQSQDSYRNGFRIGDIFCDSAAMMRDRVNALRETSVYERRVMRRFSGTLRIREVMEDVIHAEMGFLVLESIVDEAPAIFTVGKSIDEIVPSGAAFSFRRRVVVYDHSYVRNSLIFPL